MENNYQTLTIIEKIEMVGKLVHAIQSDNEMYNLAKELLTKAEEKGLFINIKILPNDYENRMD